MKVIIMIMSSLYVLHLGSYYECKCQLVSRDECRSEVADSDGVCIRGSIGYDVSALLTSD